MGKNHKILVYWSDDGESGDFYFGKHNWICSNKNFYSDYRNVKNASKVYYSKG